MRIAVLADRLTMGGLETHIITFTNELLRRGHQILLYTAHTEPDIIAQINKENSSFHYLFWTADPVGDLLNFKPEIIHAHPFTAIVKGYDIAKALQRPLIITMHGLYDFGLDRSLLGNRISERAYAIIAVDQAVANVLQSSTAHPEKVAIIHNGIDLTYFYPQRLNPVERQKYGFIPEWYTITAISRFDDGKERSIIQLLRTATTLANYLSGLNLIIVGDGSCYSQIKIQIDQINGFNQKLKIHLAGHQNDVRPFINIADMVLACDRAALEAMACERAVYTMNGSGFAGAIDSQNFRKILLNRSGYYEFSDEELVSGLLNLLKNEPYRQQLAASGLQIIQQYFNIIGSATQLEIIFKQSLTSRG